MPPRFKLYFTDWYLEVHSLCLFSMPYTLGIVSLRWGGGEDQRMISALVTVT